MYGFGDDRNPANDTINVMEEILVEYIVDVVRLIFPAPERVCLVTLTNFCLIVPNCARTWQKIPLDHRRSQAGTV